jgi:hypothetical protein
VAVLTDAELVLGLSQHLSAYAMGPERAALGELEFRRVGVRRRVPAAREYDLPGEAGRAIGLDVGLSSRNLREVMTTLASMGWVSIDRDNAGRPGSVFGDHAVAAARGWW